MNGLEVPVGLKDHWGQDTGLERKGIVLTTWDAWN